MQRRKPNRIHKYEDNSTTVGSQTLDSHGEKTKDDFNSVFGLHVNTGLDFDRFGEPKVQSSGTRPIPKPIKHYQDAAFHPKLMSNIANCHYPKPTPIQKHAIPTILAGRDLMACAQTGSGKTAAYLIPIIQMLLDAGGGGGDDDYPEYPQAHPKALIIAPTRELAVQIDHEAKKFSFGTGIKSFCFFGGEPKSYQYAADMSNCSILVGTPGRLLDCLKDGSVVLDDIKFFVLDEADRMLDKGFKPEVRRVHIYLTAQCPQGWSTLMISATFPRDLQVHAAKTLLKKSYIFNTVGTTGAANYDVDQTILRVEDRYKTAKLMELLAEDLDNAIDVSGEYTKKTLVFVQMIEKVETLAAELTAHGFPNVRIHRERDQKKRTSALNQFKQGLCPILVATSVAARGLDIPGVDHVINYYLIPSIAYDNTCGIEDWVHRVGRTGRAGKAGRATTFYDPDVDSGSALRLVEVGVKDWVHRVGRTGRAGKPDEPPPSTTRTWILALLSAWSRWALRTGFTEWAAPGGPGKPDEPPPSTTRTWILALLSAWSRWALRTGFTEWGAPGGPGKPDEPPPSTTRTWILALLSAWSSGAHRAGRETGRATTFYDPDVDSGSALRLVEVGVKDWVHRVGRTGRAGKAGRATTFYDPDVDSGSALRLVEVGVKDWVHRVGRTGRAGKAGRATTFYDPDVDSGSALRLVEVCVKDWVHRVGRTGRAGKAGRATTFYDPDVDSGSALRLVEVGVKDWVHRVGRTGRAGKAGRATTFYDPDVDSGSALRLVEVGVKDWVHRVGRTGRAGKAGRATTFYDPDVDSGSALRLVEVGVKDWVHRVGRTGRAGKGATTFYDPDVDSGSALRLVEVGVKDWVHRVGRTGRAGKAGRATTFYDPDVDSGSALRLVEVGVKDWVHRVGRTGRAGKAGRATTFYDPDVDSGSALRLVEELGKAQQDVPDWLLKDAKLYKSTAPPPDGESEDEDGW